MEQNRERERERTVAMEWGKKGEEEKEVQRPLPYFPPCSLFLAEKRERGRERMEGIRNF